MHAVRRGTLIELVARSALLTMALCLGASGWAQEVSNPAAPAQPVYNPGDLHLESSRVFARVGKTGFGHEHAIVGQVKQGTVHLGAEQDAGQITFDLTSFTADAQPARDYLGLAGSTDASTQQQVTANMLGKDVLNVKQYPTATFQVKSAKPVAEASKRGLPQYRLEGEFTLHGATRPIQVLADVEEKNGWVHLRGGFSVLQTQYGITPYTKAFGAVGVADRIDIWGDLWLAKERQAVSQR